jgi:hypothetical protein
MRVAVVSGSALDPIDKNDLARIVHRVPPGAPSQHMAKLRHIHVSAMLIY